jgi:hypothetical protein
MTRDEMENMKQAYESGEPYRYDSPTMVTGWLDANGTPEVEQQVAEEIASMARWEDLRQSEVKAKLMAALFMYAARELNLKDAFAEDRVFALLVGDKPLTEPQIAIAKEVVTSILPSMPYGCI